MLRRLLVNIDIQYFGRLTLFVFGVVDAQILSRCLCGDRLLGEPQRLQRLDLRGALWVVGHGIPLLFDNAWGNLQRAHFFFIGGLHEIYLLGLSPHVEG